MAITEIKTIEITPNIIGRNGWQLSDESEEDEGAVLPAEDLDIKDDEEDDDFDLGNKEFDEE